MKGLIHTTELDRLHKPQALSPTPPLHHSPHLPLPQAEARPQNLFRDFKFHAPSGNRARDLVMKGLIHTTELDRLHKAQALSPTPPLHHSPHLPLPQPQNLFRDFKFHAPSGNRARDLVMKGLIHTTELDRLHKPQALSPTPPLHHSPHLPLPQAEAGPQNLFRDSKF